LNSVQPLHYCGKEFCHFVALILWFRFAADASVPLFERISLNPLLQRSLLD